MIDLSPLDAVPKDAWGRLAERRVYFGHQSVGYNILEGVREIVALRPEIRLRIVESSDPAELDRPGLVHSKNGTNTDAASKIQAFANLMNAGAGERAHLAFFKFCYVDIREGVDPAGVFHAYSGTMDALRARFPRARFLHATIPLTALPRGPKQTLKKLLGRPLWGYDQNRRRGEYNRLLRERYGSDGGVFDIAALESTRPDGTPQTFTWQGATHAALCPAYTNDGGHLGPLGRQLAARRLLAWLAEAAA